MATLGVSGLMFQCVFEGSLSMQDTEIERRPYHKNCNCAMHKSKESVCSSACQKRNISFPKKQIWTEGSLCMEATSKFSSSPLSLPGNASTSRTGNRRTEYELESFLDA